MSDLRKAAKEALVILDECCYFAEDMDVRGRLRSALEAEQDTVTMPKYVFELLIKDIKTPISGWEK